MHLRAPQIRALCSISLLYSCMVNSVLGTSYDYGFDVTKELKTKRQSDSTFVVTSGMPLSSNGSVPVRSEIRDLEKDEDAWNLYILALDMLQYTDQTDDTSWYGLAAIHGVPFEDWGGVKPTAGNEQAGYCQHETILFPTWHRAYLSLYEQEICAREQYIATLYNSGAERNRLIKKAADCRIPYYDWAATPPDGESMLPFSIGGSSEMDVTGPAGTQTISNPLYTYNFNPLDSSIFFNITPWADWNSTRRFPFSNDWDTASNDSGVDESLSTHLAQNQQRLYTLLSSYDNFTIFSNEGWAEDTSQYDSLEALHDNVHAMFGGSNGHMTIVPFSAFDATFFLHHCMVDRVFALWQVIYPNSWITPEEARSNAYTTSVGDILTSTSDLTPFYASSNGTFWNSDMLRDPEVLGYTYPEMTGISLSNATSISEGRSRVASAINQLYGQSSSNSLSISSKRSTLGSPIHNKRQNGGPPSRELPVSKIISQQGEFREYTANIRVEKQGLDGPFSVSLSLGDNTRIGSMGVFASPPEIASLMQTAPGAQYVSSAVPLTKVLVDELSDGTISSMDTDVVGKFLTDNLQVTVTKCGDVEVPPEDVPGLSIRIVSSLVQSTATKDELPVWGAPDYKLDIM